MMRWRKEVSDDPMGEGFHWYEAKTSIGDVCVSREPDLDPRNPWQVSWYPMNEGDGMHIVSAPTLAKAKEGVRYYFEMVARKAAQLASV